MTKTRPPRIQPRRPKRKHKRLSRKARLLINHLTSKRVGLSLREAARRLGLKNHGDLYAMKNGKIGETPEMTAAVQRAEQKAHRAFLGAREPKTQALELSLLKVAVDKLSSILEELRQLVPPG